MMFLPAARLRTRPFPPFVLAALRFAAAIRVPRVFFAISMPPLNIAMIYRVGRAYKGMYCENLISENFC